MGMHGGMGLGGGPMRSIWEQRRSRQYMDGGGRPSKETAARLWQVMKPHRRPLMVAMALTTLGVLLGLIPPLVMRAIIDRAIARHNLSLLFTLAGALILFPALGAIVSVGQNYFNTVIAQGIIHDMRTALYDHGQKLGIEFFTKTPGGEIHSRLVNDLNAVQQVLTRAFSGLFVNALTVVLTLGIMYYLNWKLAIIATIILPTFAFPVVSFGRRTYDAITRAQNALSRMTAHLEETLTLSGIIVVKSFGTAPREARRFNALSQDVRHTQIQQNLVGQWLSLVVGLLSALGPALLYGYGGYLVIRGTVGLGTVVAFAAYLRQLYNPASSLAGSNTTLLGGLALFDRIFSFLDQPIDVAEPLSPAPLPRTSHPARKLAFDNVSFHYKGHADTLHGVSFVARPGQLTALVGPSGAGKTTILSLAARFYDPAQGQVLLDGVPLDHLSEGDLRQAMAIVTQDLFLFHDTLKENIRYGKLDATEEEMASAIEASQLTSLLASLPDGLSTIVGERGYRLSGGEKQRVAIARAILRNPGILLLDEATSSLDSHAERLIQEALAKLFQGRTVMAIAHRLSTILAADQILVINQGRIIERGRHHELLAQQGLYTRLYHEQFDTPKNQPALS